MVRHVDWFIPRHGQVVLDEFVQPPTTVANLGNDRLIGLVKLQNRPLLLLDSYDEASVNATACQ
jgi:hypothetical protein